MHSKNTFKIYLYEIFSCFINSKNKKDFKFFYIKMLVIFSSVKIQMISSFSSFFHVKISVVFTSVKRKRISRFFWIKNLVILSSIKIKRFYKLFLYIDFSCFIISKNIRTAQEITRQLEFSPKPFNIWRKQVFFRPPPFPNVDFFRCKIAPQPSNFQLFVSIFAPNMYIPPKTLNFRTLIP